MKKGELVIFGGIGLLVLVSVAFNAFRAVDKTDKGATSIPFFFDGPTELEHAGNKLVKELSCRSCHALWTMRDPGQAVPAPALDGIGSLKTEQWLYDYLSAERPQDVVPSRLKKEYQMPSFASLPEEERRTLASYLAHLKVQDWYLKNAQNDEVETLTGVAPVSTEPTEKTQP